MPSKSVVRLRWKCDGTRAGTRFLLSAKRTSPFKSAGASVQSTTGSRGVRISGSNAGYTMFRGSVKGNGYPLHSPVSPSLPLPCVTVCHHISTGVYQNWTVAVYPTSARFCFTVPPEDMNIRSFRNIVGFLSPKTWIKSKVSAANDKIGKIFQIWVMLLFLLC